MKRVYIIVTAAVCFILSLGLTLYPVISNVVNTKYASEIHTAYENVLKQADNSQLQASREQAENYNRMMTPGVTTENAFSKGAIAAASDNYENLLNISGNGIMGYVVVPKLNVQLPIFHGTNSDSLDRGVGHLLGSSLPIGGESTHTILTGHSGMATQRMFTDLINLSIGDVFYLEVLGDTLAYQVDEINTVLPHDTSLLGITPGMDYCTLVTCTPYGVNTHRLLVRGTRIPYEKAKEAEQAVPTTEESVSKWNEEYIRGIAIGLLIVLVLFAAYFLVTGYRIGISKRARIIFIIGMLLAFLAGALFFAYPYIDGARVDREIRQEAQFFLETAVPPTEAPADFSAPEETPPREPAGLWEAMQSYNQSIWEEEQSALSDPWAYQQASFRLADYNLEDEVFGVISIPKLSLEMPIYLGATADHMALGAAHLSQTSLPIGGDNCNSVIAGHRGWGGASYFRYVPDLEIDDEVVITNLWETLHYTVVGKQIIMPNDVDAIRIRPGKDLVTLLTCHPYASGGKQRYLVFCERTEGGISYDG